MMDKGHLVVKNILSLGVEFSAHTHTHTHIEETPSTNKQTNHAPCFNRNYSVLNLIYTISTYIYSNKELKEFIISMNENKFLNGK